MSQDRAELDNDLRYSLLIAPYLFAGSFLLVAAASIWSSPPLGFLATALASGAVLFLAKMFHWKTGRLFVWFLCLVGWFVPYLLARRHFFGPPGSAGFLPMMQYAFVAVVVVSGLPWVFREKLRSMRGVQ